MNSFMNALWNANGSMVTGFHKDEPFIGSISNVRTKAGNELSVTVDTDEGEVLLISGTDLMNGAGNLFTNLHVYF
jgi:hypothetical protein